nr:chymotrypsin-like protease CTRL-1 [Drosophila kikkawai]
MKTTVIQIVAFACLLGLVMPLPEGDQFLDAECGIRAQHRSKRVVNGTVADMTSSPWMVFLRDEDYFICGGTLISNRLVLTTASCIKGHKNLMARLGEYWRHQESKCFGTYCTEREEHPVEKAIIHPYYNSIRFVNDIAILLLQGTVVFKANIRPICIARNTVEWAKSINEIQKLTGTGWGYTENGRTSNELRTLEIWRQTPDVCAEFVGLNVTSKQFCAGSRTSTMCNGDSGGPVGAMISTTKGDRFVQIGIASYTNYQCRRAVVFTDVLSHIDFILSVWRQYSS